MEYISFCEHCSEKHLFNIEINRLYLNIKMEDVGYPIKLSSLKFNITIKMSNMNCLIIIITSVYY